MHRHNFWSSSWGPWGGVENLVMWHIKLKGMGSRPGYTEKILAYDQTGDLGMGSKGQLPLDFFEKVGICAIECVLVFVLFFGN